MNLVKKLIYFSMSFAMLSIVSGCAAGSATAGYSLKAHTADNLSAEAEQRIVDRTKREMYAEMECPPPM